MTTRRRHGERGQAFIELALSIPVLILIVLGTVDLGRAFYVNLPVTGMASVGAQVGATSSTADVGLAVRQESNIVPDTAVAWGNVYYDSSTKGANSTCNTTPATGTQAQPCGDPHGCQTSGSTDAFSSASRIACFAVGMCTLDANHDGQCTSAVTWQARPPAGATSGGAPSTNAALVVKVVYAFTPSTPLIANFFRATGSILYLSQTAVITEQY